MNSGELQQLDPLDPEAGSAEVEFALVLARMIASVNEDPEQLRQAIYDLARHKLEEQFTLSDEREIKQTRTALERAIRGVEAFSHRHEHTFALGQPSLRQTQALPVPDVGPATTIASPPAQLSRPIAYHPAPDEPIFTVKSRSSSQASSRLSKRRTWSWFLAAAAVMLAACGAVAVVHRKPELLPARLSFLKADRSMTAEQTKSAEAKSAAKSADSAAPKPAAVSPSPLVPTVYGVYAVSDNKLHELNMLPTRAPDLRVAISPIMGTPPGHAAFYGSHPRFVVYRREAASTVPERADVRIIARITRETSFDAAGKLVVSDDDGWAIRNISFPYRTAPNKDNPEMYEILPEEGSAELTAGRYALVFKGQAYDFTVAGPVTDLRHCLERLKAANGTFMSECRKPDK